MSTSSGRKGYCSRCGHANNEHAREKEAKCKKCKKGFEVCQVGVHGDVSSPGWRICFAPCTCGEKYYPDKAKSAKPLEPHEYVTTHAGYRAMSYPDENDISFNTSQDAASKAVGYVSTPGGSSAGQVSYGHARGPSNESMDPLSWTPRRIAQYTVNSITEDLSNVQIESGSGVSSWSAWEWSDEYECDYRYRQNSAMEGGYEYDYRPAASTSKHHKSKERKGKGKETKR